MTPFAPVFALLALVLGSATSARAATPPTPYDREVAALGARFHQQIEQHRPAAVIPVLQLAGLYEQVQDRDAVLRLAADMPVAAARAHLPLVQAHALWLSRELLRHQGQTDAATAITRELGLVPASAFTIAGPFDNEGQRGHATAYPPEAETTAPPADRTYPGKDRAVPVRWRALPPEADTRDGVVPIAGLLRPEEWITAYAVTYVRNERTAPLPVALRLGASGAVKVFVNRGAAVLDRDLYRPLRLDQEAAAAVLRPGWNRILIKISGSEDPCAVLLRLTAPDGAPLSGLTFRSAPPEPGWALPAALPAGAAPATLLAGLRQAAAPVARDPAKVMPQAEAAARAQPLADLGIYVHHFIPGDPEAREDESLLREAATLHPTPRSYRLWAEVTSDNDRRRQVLQEASQTRFPESVTENDERAYLRLLEGRLLEEGHRDRPAEAAYHAALALCPDLYSATLSLAEIQQGRGLPAEALRLIDALTVTPLRVVRARAALYSLMGRVAEADAAYAALRRLRDDDAEAWRHELERRRARGELSEALKALAHLQAGRPEQAFMHHERVEMLEGAGQIAAALTAADEALALIPGDAELWQLKGRLLQRTASGPEALSAYRQALLLKPQNPDLRAYLRRLDPQARSAEDLARRFQVEVKTLARPPVDPRSKDPARVLLDQAVTRVHENGLSEVFTQRVLEILDERGAREYGELDIRYTPDTQSVQVKAARVHRRDGTVHESASQGERDVSEPWYGLYYDVRALVLRFDDLGPGDVIEVQYVVADVGRRNLLADYFGDFHFFQEEIPRLVSRFVLLWPAPAQRARPLYFTVSNGVLGAPLIQHSEKLEEGTPGEPPQRVYRFEARDVPRLLTEPGMPGYSEVAPFLHISTFKSWEEVATFYQGLVAEQLAASPEIRAAARAQVAGLRDERQKVRAIYDFVVQKTRYVGLEFGIHGYKPYKVAQIFARRFGDCKDKAALLHVMLREVGITSSMVLARTRRNGGMPAEPASLAAFDHAIVFVPQFDLYLDGTAEFSGSDELPEQDQDIPVLVVSDPRPPYAGKGHLARTPVLPAATSVVARTLHVALHADGSARVRDHMEVRGQVAQKWREHYQARGSQLERYEKAWSETAPGAKALKVELPGIGDLEKPVRLTGELQAPLWGRPVSGETGALTVQPLGREPDLLRSFARLSQRRYDLILGFPWRNTEAVTVELPPGYVARRLPEPRELESPLGRFRFTVERRRGEITFSADLEVDRHRIASADYPAFRRFCAEVDSIVGQDLVVSRE